ncbi:putative nudix hydrolase 6 [Parelaphostrongylus tenuis]|uniref:Nudix hydrolase 6 n=1 Tax=Parelaphostrongylus tenuis TaxID=148309 RepID=A0AAD5QGF4_PARTN|nr:putative nudix hydrolase 6 [Parelaphostrongylus tenuis]
MECRVPGVRSSRLHRPKLFGREWADPPDTKRGGFKWNTLDGNVNRVSHMGDYALDSSSRPMNPIGRTGLRGRGVLGRWGPNHAADPLVTRFKNGKLQFVAIKRSDTGEWAIPGGMVDAGEEVSQTLKREFSEETLGGKIRSELDQLWKSGRELYRGYVDDPRNTDNAWMETVCVNFHDTAALLDNVELKAGDDAVDVRWIGVDDKEPLYASHEDFIALLKQLHGIK